MKKLTIRSPHQGVSLLLSTLVVVASCAFARAQNDTQVNPLDVGRAFALKSPAFFKLQLQGRTLMGDSWQDTIMLFAVRKSDFAITNLTINGVSIPLPKPIYGLPMGDGGIMADVNINATAFTASGEFAGHGYNFVRLVSVNDQIEVVVRPADVRRQIPVDVGRYGNDIKLEIEEFIYGYGYGVDGDKFYVYLPPIGGKYHYILRRWSTGEPIGEGWVEPFKDPVVSENAYVGIRYLGNVIGVEFNKSTVDEWIAVPHVQYDCSIPTEDGTNVFGKVISVDVGAQSLEVIVNGKVDVYVYQATADGDMPLLKLEDRSTYHETRVNTIVGKVGKAVVVIVPYDASGNSWINLHKYLDVPSAPPPGKG